MKKLIALALLGLMLLGGSTSVVLAASDTTGHCKLCGCTHFQQENSREGECVCGHSKGIHASVSK